MAQVMNARPRPPGWGLNPARRMTLVIIVETVTGV
jgi:hypothetical protein